MRIKLLTILSVVVLFASCKKDGGKAHIALNVKSGNTVIPDVYIALLNDEDHFYRGKESIRAKTNVDGQLRFDVIPGKIYYLYHYTEEWILSSTKGSYILIGKFDSQHEIDNSPPQPPTATVGGDKYQDIDHDGAVNERDVVLKVTAPSAGKTLTIDFPMILSKF